MSKIATLPSPGIPLEESPKERPWWHVPAIGAATGTGVFALSRIPSKAAKGTILRKLQDRSQGVVYYDREWLTGDGKTHKNVLQRLKDYLLYGRGVNLKDPEVIKELKRHRKETGQLPFVVTSGNKVIPGTYNPMLGVYRTRGEGLSAAARANRLEDKYRESRVLSQVGGDVSPATKNLSVILRKYNIGKVTRKNLHEKLPLIQKALRKEYGKQQYIIKTKANRRGTVDENVNSAGVFPTEKTNLTKAYKQWEKLRPQFIASKKDPQNDINTVIKMYRNRPGYEGRVLESLTNDNLIVQERVPLKKFPRHVTKELKRKGYVSVPEYRVHSIGGYAAPILAFPRSPSGLLRLPEEVRAAREASHWFQTNVIDKLPKKYKGLSYGADVVRGADGKFRTIELNTGPDSGFLTMPLVPHALHKQLTGRHSLPVSLMLGGGSAAFSGGIAHKILKPETEENA